MSKKAITSALKWFPFGLAVLIGVFLTVASHAFEWSHLSTLVVGVVLVALLGLFGPVFFYLPQLISARISRGAGSARR